MMSLLTFILNLLDTKSNQKMLQRLLLRAGDIESHCADDGLIALQKAFDADGRANYDLIFMDYTMPVMVRE